ncbi:MAG: 50S ribosomal protein L13 [Proteobacteria bacterium]|nr:50S ribosomal protein L13 [Pseudomonadota bacterium]MBU4469939.1 50S ribosomal protein L13 [Pseudomonadota bacterium]
MKSFFLDPILDPQSIFSIFPLTLGQFFISKHRLFNRQEYKALKKYTYNAKDSDNKGKWWVVNAEGKVLGRLATTIASVLRGKHNPLFTPHADTGDSVVVINAEKIMLTGNKLEDKKYYRYSGFNGGLKTITAGKLLEKRPEDLIRFAVKGMLPKNKLGSKIFGKLKVYAGNQHPHEAQNPEDMNL